MTNLNRSHEENMLTDYVAGRVIDYASGRLDPECVLNYPRDVYFIGNLRPRADDATSPTSPAYLRELLTKLSPFAFGAEFKLTPTDNPVRISFVTTWSCYYRVFPTWQQQRGHQLGTAASEAAGHSAPNTAPPETHSPTISPSTQEGMDDQRTDEAGEDAEEHSAADRSAQRTASRGPRDSMFIRFRKIVCSATGDVVLSRRADDTWSTDTSDLQNSIDAEMVRAVTTVLNDPERVRTERRPDEQVRVPESALGSETDFTAFLRSLNTEVPVEWRIHVNGSAQLDQRGESAGPVLLVQFVNASPIQVPAPNNEAYLFDVGTTLAVSAGTIVPFELDLLPQSFRYDRDLWGRGFNCCVYVQSTQPLVLATTHAPMYHQPRFVTRTDPPALFAELAHDPVPPLMNILEQMELYQAEWDRELDRLIDSGQQAAVDEFRRDREIFTDEINRFRAGVETIRDNADVRLAFQLLNETFLRVGADQDPARHKDRWRIFQIVFIVAQLPGMAALVDNDEARTAERAKVDIIYFPTGGGKTEAYLGVIALHCFFDRLRGKTGGVTAWTRFPLRLLTLQQTQRVADVIAVADLVRREHSDLRLTGAGIDGFAIGYFVGQTSSPNELKPPRDTGDPSDPAWSQANDPSARQQWKRITRCPSCKTSNVSVEFDPRLVRLTHKCLNDQCRFPNGEIPVLIVDNEIYRYLPAVIVGTLDKLAGLGNQRKFAMILGRVDGLCSDHGYYLRRCCQADCQDPTKLQVFGTQAVSGPNLFVQDELHLINEGLGTFDGHYETFVQRLLREFGESEPLKIIASSATIEAFQRQVEHLYGRPQNQARLFPGQGPTLAQSFYAETLDHPQRTFIGIIPHNKTIFNTMLELIDQCHRQVQELTNLNVNSTNPYGGSFTPATSEWFSMLDNYRTSLTYFLAGRELNSVRTDLVGDVNPNLRRDGLLPLNPLELTGNTSTDDVSHTLEHLERPASPTDDPDAILATSMISHGVDIDRLNLMIFYGMPRQNAEYIQASSRVGRSHAGIVFACLHPARERDQSHYAYFSKYHQFLGQLVEPVAINRWSKFSINRTIPGLFMGTVLQVLANRNTSANPNLYYMLEFMKQQITSGAVQASDVIPLMLESYMVATPSTIGESAFREDILLRVPQLLDQVIGASSGLTFVSDALYPSPMRSLREVDEAIEIELDSNGSVWADR